MSLEKEIAQRSESKCELCGSNDDLQLYFVPPVKEKLKNNTINTCTTCKSQLENPESLDANHWRCLNDSMWSEVEAVKVVSYRMLHALKAEGWPQDLIDMMYLEDETLAWAKDGMVDENTIVHKDAFGAVLKAGDTVVLTQSLNVKGSSAQAKRGTAVRRISLVQDNPEQIEGKVDGQQIVILTKYVKKSN
ncbi:MAG: PhnA domain-containing protein [Chitinophagales bacterium]